MKKVFFFNFIISLLLFGCELEDPQEGIKVEDVVKVHLKDGSSSNILADGVSQAEIVAELGSQSDANQSVTFTTDEGVFVEASGDNKTEYTVIASSKTAIVTLRASTKVKEKVTIKATVGDFVSTTNIEFKRAFPTDYCIDISPSIISTDKIATSTITIDLFRNGIPNSVSDGTKVLLNWAPSSPNSNAEADFPPFVYVDEGRATATIRSKNGIVGEVVITPSINGVIPAAPECQSSTIEFQ